MKLDSQAIIEAADPYITDILDKLGMEWMQESSWIATPCIFHGGTNFKLKYKNLKFYCFSECNKSYSVIDVVKKALDLNFVAAMKWLCSELGLSADDYVVSDKKIKSRKNLKLMKRLSKKKSHTEYKQVDQLILNDIIPYSHPYLLNQGFSDNTLRYFNIGFCLYGELENRVCFPIDAPDGTIISISGRAIDGAEPKYFIIGNTFKNLTLYNYSRAKAEAIERGYVILVEGFKSVMKLHEFGYKNSVACMGSSIDDKQMKLLLKLGVIIVVCGDNDKAGKLLNQKVYNMCYKFTKVIKLPMSKYTEKEADSIADLDNDAMFELVDDLDGIK